MSISDAIGLASMFFVFGVLFTFTVGYAAVMFYKSEIERQS